MKSSLYLLVTSLLLTHLSAADRAVLGESAVEHVCVGEWLPAGTTFPNPPTLEGHVTRLPDVHISGKGLREHGTRRTEKVGAWLQQANSNNLQRKQ
jgi:hypothetical protein